jgi:hypothetical protein
VAGTARLGGGEGARRRLNHGAPDLSEPQVAQMLGLRAHLLGRQDSRVRAVFSAWSRCMRQTGFHYPDPMAANNDPAFTIEQPTENEIRTAIADVQCKRKVGVAEVWAAVETAYQRQAVDAHHDQLEVIRQAIHIKLVNARAVLAGRPHP